MPLPPTVNTKFGVETPSHDGYSQSCLSSSVLSGHTEGTWYICPQDGPFSIWTC